jgi:hypothetical protein
MRAGSGFLALAVASTMCGCATLPPPPRPFPDEQIHDSGGVAYLWTAGRVDQPAMSLLDYAVVISIDGRALPSEYRPAAGTQPFVAWRVEVPVGRHAVEVLDKEETLVCSVLGGCLVMDDQTRVIEFVAEAGRAYVPLADDKCFRKWIWIADAGPVAAEDSNTRQLAVSTGLANVGGESPPEDSC